MQLPFIILCQPIKRTSGPTCLHSIYRYHHDSRTSDQVIFGVRTLEHRGIFAVLLICQLLGRRYKPTTYDITGKKAGYFTLLCWCYRTEELLYVADSLCPDPISMKSMYKFGTDRVICTTLLGVLTCDANLLIFEKPESEYAEFDCGK